MEESYVNVASTSTSSTILNSKEISTETRLIQIERAIASFDVKKLLELGIQGFESNNVRKLVWPILIKGKGKQVERNVEFDSLPIHKDESQVRLDVDRSFIHFPQNLSTKDKAGLRAQLELVIITVLRQHPSLNYFQGYHDIIAILLLTLESVPLTIQLAAHLSLHQIRDNLSNSLEPVIGHLKLVQRILSLADPEFANLVDGAAHLPYFSLSWVLTLLSHDLEEEPMIARFFDFLLGRNPAMICYLTVAIILTKKDEMLELDQDDISDPAILHHTLSKLPTFSETPQSSSTPIQSPDEDLLSHSTDDDETDNESFTTESMVSMSGDDEENETFDPRMLEDPDIFGPAFSFIGSIPSSSGSRTPSIQSIKFIKLVQVDELILKSLELWNQFPLLGKGGINADEIMGSKSCIFTFPLSQEGSLSIEQVEEISKNGIDLVVEEMMEEIEIVDLVEKEKKIIRREREKKLRNVVAVTVVVVGISSILLAFYVDKFKWKSLSILDWWVK